MNLFLIIMFALASLFSLGVGVIIFYHFKKFSLPDDFFSIRILTISKWGTVALLFISFIFLIILFL